MMTRSEYPPPVSGPDLHWTCVACGSTWTVPMPEFPGSAISGSHVHYVGGDPDRACGPLVAVMLGRHARA